MAISAYRHWSNSRSQPKINSQPLKHNDMDNIAANTNKAIVDQFFIALETQNFGLLKEIFADNGRQLNPYVPEGFPKSFDGREGIYQQYSSLPQLFGRMEFPRTLLATEDPDFIFVK